MARKGDTIRNRSEWIAGNRPGAARNLVDGRPRAPLFPARSLPPREPAQSKRPETMKRRQSRAGLTLLEVMIAVALLSLLMVGVMTSLRLGLNALSKTNTRLMADRRVVGAQRVLEQQLDGFMPVIARFSPTPEAPPTEKMPFFQGEPQSMRLVSTYSLQEAARGIPRVLEYQVI